MQQVTANHVPFNARKSLMVFTGWRKNFQKSWELLFSGSVPFAPRSQDNQAIGEGSDLASLSKEERRLYDADIRAYRDRLTELGTAKRDGEKRGIIKGRIEGEKIGERRGEKNKQLSIARNLKEKGLPVALIVETTGLSAEEVENL